MMVRTVVTMRRRRRRRNSSDDKYSTGDNDSCYGYLSFLTAITHIMPLIIIMITRELPSGKPTITSAHNLSSNSIKISWRPPNDSTINGEFLGYQVSVSIIITLNYVSFATNYIIVDNHYFLP